MNARCGAIRSNGSPCRNWPVAGATRCRKHGAASPQVARRALVKAELAKWGLGDSTIDPGELLLRLTAQAAARVEFLSGLLAEQYALAESGESTTTLPARIAVLTGPTFALSRDGEPVPIGEAIRALVYLEGIERDRAAGFAAKAVQAGLQTRVVEQAEQVGSMISTVLRQVIADPQLGLTAAQQAAFPAVLRSTLQLVGG